MNVHASTATSSSADRTWRRWHFGRSVLDERTHELFVDGVDAELERKPLEVLMYLLQHAGEVCTKDELLAGVWPGRILSETVLTKCIGRIRDVLVDDNQEIIKTSYGFGYRFVAPVRVETTAAAEPVRFDICAGMHPPARPLWSLVERLGGGGHGEAWRARHDKTGEQRVFKFALEERALVALKREITLFRVIHDTVGDNARVVKLLDWNLEQLPYFVEAEFIAGGSLVDWVAVRGGIFGMSVSDRLEVVAKIAEALGAVHSVGVLHKDLKPSNVLVKPLPGNSIDIVLADFGSGGVLDFNRLEALGITRLGFTKTIATPEMSSGTPLYLAPEILAGQPFTVKSDIYALGIILYQFLAGDFHKVMSPGWERGIDDELLREDIALMAEGNPAERLGDAAALARRLRTLDERRRQLIADREAQARAERARRVLERAQARRFGLILAFAALCAGLIVSTSLYFKARQAQRRAEQAAEATRAVTGFLSKDLFGSIDLSKRAVRDLTIKEVLDAGAAQIDTRFRDAPDVAAEIHAAVGASYMASELPEVDDQLNRALELYESTKGVGSSEGLTILAQLLGFHHTPEQTKLLVAHAERALVAGRRQYGEANDAVLQLRFRSALGQYQQGDWVREVEELQSLSADMDRYFPNAPHFDGQLSRLLGSGLFSVADFANAEQWLVRARTEIERAPGHSSAFAQVVHMDLGALYRETERYAEAEQELSLALAGMRQLVPDNSAFILQIRRNQGQLKLEEGQAAEASTILQEVINVLSSSPHDTDRDGSWLVRYFLGLAYQAQGHLEEAASMLRGSLERCEAAKGLEYPLTEQIRIGLAEVLRLQGKSDEAQGLLARVDMSGLPGLPRDHPILGELRRTQGLLLKQRGQIEASRAALTEALRIFTLRYGKAHWRTRRGQDDLAQLT